MDFFEFLTKYGESNLSTILVLAMIYLLIQFIISNRKRDNNMYEERKTLIQLLSETSPMIKVQTAEIQASIQNLEAMFETQLESYANTFSKDHVQLIEVTKNLEHKLDELNKRLWEIRASISKK
ncbi:MAG: hypothetical protein WBI01_07830 [Syntrophomonadaceae bacterium]